MRFWCVCGYLCVYLYMCSSHRSHIMHWILLSPSICLKFLYYVSFHLLHFILMNWNLSLTLFVYILEISYDHNILTIVYWDLCKVQISSWYHLWMSHSKDMAFGSYFNAGQPNHFFLQLQLFHLASYSYSYSNCCTSLYCNVLSAYHGTTMSIFLIITFKSFMMNILFV